MSSWYQFDETVDWKKIYKKNKHPSREYIGNGYNLTKKKGKPIRKGFKWDFPFFYHWIYVSFWLKSIKYHFVDIYYHKLIFLSCPSSCAHVLYTLNYFFRLSFTRQATLKWKGKLFMSFVFFNEWTQHVLPYFLIIDNIQIHK